MLVAEFLFSMGRVSSRLIFVLLCYVYLTVIFDTDPSFLADVWSFSIATQQWTSVVSAAAAPRGYYGGDMDDRNMIYYFGGQSTSNGKRTVINPFSSYFY